MSTHRFPVRKLFLFGTLSVADLLLTRQLIKTGDGYIYETNPIANWWLSCYGWLGLAAYKAGLVLAVVTLIVAISLRRPQTGGRLLTFACSAVAVVVLYSGFLLGVVHAGFNGWVPTVHPTLVGMDVVEGRLATCRVEEMPVEAAEEQRELMRRYRPYGRIAPLSTSAERDTQVIVPAAAVEAMVPAPVTR